MSGSAVEVHHEIRELVHRHGSYVITDPGEFRAAFEDVLGGGGELPLATVNLLVDAVRHQVALHVVQLVDNGADQVTAIRTAGDRFAEVRGGGGDSTQCSWAAAVLGYAAGRVSDAAWLTFTTTQRPPNAASSAPPPPAPPRPPALPTLSAQPPPTPADPTLRPPVPRPPQQPARPGRRRGLLVVIGSIVVLLLAGAGAAWWLLDSEGAGAGGEDTVEGHLIGDPSTIRAFSDPAEQIVSDGDLVDYLLPGLLGTGADCVEDEVDSAEVLEPSDTAERAASVADLILACVAPDEIGKIFGMYAVGFEEDGPSLYAELSVCVEHGFSDLEPDVVEEALVNVYTERLDLAGPPTSRTVAAEEIEDLTTCSASAAPAETPDDSLDPVTTAAVAG